MMRSGAFAAALLAGVALAPAARAQTAPPALLYVQPLSTEAVRQVQAQLQRLGFYHGRQDGIWGPDSADALQQFQNARGLRVSGQIDPPTLAMLGLNPGQMMAGALPPAPAPYPTAQGGPAPSLAPGVVRVLERQLRGFGFYHGAIDGIDGPEMHNALMQFQQSRGLQPTGELNPGTIAALGLNPNNLLAYAQ